MKRTPYLIAFGIGLALLILPLIRDFHFELALVMSLAGTIWAIISAPKLEIDKSITEALRIISFLFVASSPSLIFALIKGCFTFHGLGFWLLFVIPSVFFSISLHRALKMLKLKPVRLFSSLLLVGFAVVEPVIELLSFPQVYLFNHVWGGWPGPIYDETVLITPSLLLFRSMTLFWIVIFWYAPDFNAQRLNKYLASFSIITLLFSYTQLDDWGIIAPPEVLQQKLSLHKETTHFNLYFDAMLFTEEEAEYYASKHEFYFSQIENELDLNWPEGRKISSYLYAHAWQKKSLVGAKFTSYVPVWLADDQLHIAKQQLDGVLKHELVHVMAKQFGNIFNASWNIGLIEGLATALDKDSSPSTTLNQLVAAQENLPDAKELKKAFSFSGFYGSAAGISYNTTGSFVQFLSIEYPIEDLKTAYKTGSFNHYPDSFETMTEKWQRRLALIPTDSLDQQFAEYIFGQRSLFQRDCPHKVTRENQLFDNARYAETISDTSEWNASLTELYALDESNDFVKTEWIRTSLFTNNADKVIQSVQNTDTLITHQLMKADALVLKGNWDEAFELLDTFRDEIEKSPARQFRYSIDLRKDSLNWKHHVDRRYRNEISQDVDLTYANKMLSLSKSLDRKGEVAITYWLDSIKAEPINNDFFDIYALTLDYLAYTGKSTEFADLAEQLLDTELRLRYSQRLGELFEYHNFMQQYP